MGDLPSPTGSGPGFRRHYRRSAPLLVPLTSNLKWSNAPGNVILPSKATGLARDSVANVSQILTIDRELLTECAGKISSARVQLTSQALTWSSADRYRPRPLSVLLCLPVWRTATPIVFASTRAASTLNPRKRVVNPPCASSPAK